jgi:putative transposase
VQALMSRGPAGPKRKLSKCQCEQLSELLIAGPEAQGYTTALWTLPRVSKLITQHTGLRYHQGHIWKLLRHLGFSCQQPSRRAIERDEAAIAHWKKVDWPRIKKKPAARGAPSSSSTRAD